VSHSATLRRRLADRSARAGVDFFIASAIAGEHPHVFKPGAPSPALGASPREHAVV